jgi:predicted Zn-dependent protease
MKLPQKFRALYAAIACLLLAACAVQQARVQPGTIPPGFAPNVAEEAYGKRVFSSLSEDYPIDSSSENHAQLSAVFNHLAESATVNPADWKVFLFDAPGIADIRAVQGNYIFVWSGIFDVVGNEDELAGLLACEMAHELANHTDPVEFDMASELLFGITDVATTVGIMVLTQGAVAISGTGMTRWAYVEAADLDPVDRVYSDQQIEDMAAITLMILETSDYSTDGLLQFWKRAESDTQLQKKLKRLSRRLPPEERIAIFESVKTLLPAADVADEKPAEITRQTVHSGEKD